MVNFKKRVAQAQSLRAQFKQKETPKAAEPVDMSQLEKLFVTSQDEINRQYEKQKELRESRRSESSRQTFRIKDGEEKRIWFPQKSPWMGVNLHYIYVGGRAYHIVCTAALGECPLCDVGNNARFFAIYDVVDCTGYRINSGPNAGT